MADGEEEHVIPNRAEIQEKVTQNSIEWVELDDKERIAKQAIKAIVTRKKELNDFILEGLAILNEKSMRLTRGGHLKFMTSTSYSPLKKNDIFNILNKELNDEDRARGIMDKLYDKDLRESRVEAKLKRTKK